MKAKLLASCALTAASLALLNGNGTVGSMSPDVHPLKVGPTGRTLVDQKGRPFFWSGDTAWSLAVRLTLQEAEAYLSDRQAKGVNVVIVNVIEPDGANAYGDLPFTGRPFATPNEAYFAHVGRLVEAAAERGIAVVLAPVYLGHGCGSEGGCAEVQAASPADLRVWGRYLGRRFRDDDNLLWLVGGDTDPTPVAAQLRELVAGIREHDTRHLMSAHNPPESFAVTPRPAEDGLTVNNVYTSSTTLYQGARQAYLRTPVMPFFAIGSRSENDSDWTPQSLRAQAYWPVLSGGLGGVAGGLDAEGAETLSHAQRLFRSRSWHLLVPDWSQAVMTAGAGSWGSADYATTARTSDGATVIAYLPTARPVTIEMSAITGTEADAWWYDPASGLAARIGAFPATGPRAFAPPAPGDWVLVLDDAARGLPPPGTVDAGGGHPDAESPDGADPVLSINNVSLMEGHTGTTSFTFTLGLAPAGSEAVTVQYRTMNGSALAGSDYTAASGSVSFSPGQTSRTVTVAVLADTVPEPDETFTLVGSLSSGPGRGARTYGVATIRNDDTAAAPAIASFTAAPANLPTGGGQSTLGWSVTGATSLRIDPGIGVVTGTSHTLNVTATTIFTLTASSPAGVATRSVTVFVNQVNPPDRGGRSVAMIAPLTGQTFTAPASLRIYANGRDPNVPTNHPTPGHGASARLVEFFIDDTLVATQTHLEAEYNIFKTAVSGIGPGQHRVWIRGHFEAPVDTLDSIPAIITVEPPPAYGQTVSLSADVLLAGTQNYELVGSAASRVRLNGNGFSIRSAAGWSGRLTLRSVDVTDLGSRTDRAAPGLDVRTTSGLVIEDSIFDDSNPLRLATDGTATANVRGNTFRSNMRMPLGQQPYPPDSFAVVTLTGSSTAAKTFQGNRVGAGWVELAGARNWLVGGSTDAEGNVLIGPRVGIYPQGSQGVVVRRNYSHHVYFGGWSQGSNFEIWDASDLLIEHNVIRGSSWPVRGVVGEFRYNLVLDAGHQWMWISGDNARVHHNVFAGGDQDVAGVWLIYEPQNVEFRNNTLDAFDNPGSIRPLLVGSGSSGSALSNAIVRYRRAPSVQVDGTVAADYNVFFNNVASPQNYSDGRHPAHDLGPLNGQVNPLFTAAPTVYGIDNTALWTRQATVKQVLEAYRTRYTPAAGSPAIDAGHPGGGAGNDIGAVGAGAANAEDRFGRPDAAAAAAPPRKTVAAPKAVGTPPFGVVTHPRIWLTPPLVTALQQRAAANDPAWITLRNASDALALRPVQYPDGTGGGPNAITGGYQYFDYLDPMITLGLSYQVAKGIDATRAASYAAKGKEILLALSDPVHHGRESTDSGWSIRAYVPALALGYDWLHDRLTPAERVQVYTEINRWVVWFDQNGFGRQHPQGNYFAGYYNAKALGALATEDENPQAAAMWADWLDRLHRGMVAPYYQRWLSGGGWPEGWNYGHNGTLNMLRPLLAAWTAKGLDLIHQGSRPGSAVEGHALWMMHFAWPTRRTVDDRGRLYESDNPSGVSAAWVSEYSGLLRRVSGSTAPRFQRFAAEIRSLTGQKAGPWAEFLFWDPAAPQAEYQTALSYRTGADGQVAMRSSWATDAVWASFVAGPYTGYAGSGEQFFDQGGLALQRGGVPFLVNAVGAFMRNTVPGTDDSSGYENSIYNELFGTQSDGVYAGRRLFNTYYARRNPGYWGQFSWGPGQSDTQLTRFEDGGGYVVMRGSRLEQMYFTDHPITRWTRDVAYLRPRLAVVYDRTAVNNPAADNWMAWHVHRRPLEVAGASGTRVFDVVDPSPGVGGNLWRGRVTTLLPDGHTVQNVNVFGGGKVHRLEVRTGAPAGSARWLAVFDAAVSRALAWTALPFTAASGNVVAGAVEGAYVSSASPSAAEPARVALFGVEESPLVGALTLSAPAVETVYLLSDLQPGTFYSATATVADGRHRLTLAPGAGFRSSASGCLFLRVSASGVVTAALS